MSDYDLHVPGRNGPVEKRRDGTVLKLVLAAEPELYCNIVGEPCIRLPPIRAGPAREEWPLRSNRVRTWIAEFIWERAAIVLFEHEITRILAVLEGKAWHDQRLDVELKDAIEQEPVLEAILIWLSSNGRFEGTSTKLLDALRQTAKRFGVDTQSRAWPKGPAQLSRRIGELTKLLIKGGVEVEIGRRPGGERYIILARREAPHDDGEPSSQAPSIDKSHHPKTLPSSDGSDAKDHSELFSRLKQRDELRNP